jgi:YidC/Oxa1 family membrane protein insertase
VTFNFFSLDYLYYPVSGIMWVWHKVFGAVLGPDNVWAWVLSVIFLIFTLRALLFKPFMKQMDSQLKMQAVQPEMKKLREKYKDDRQRLAEEMMKLNKEAGVNPVSGCLPALVQAPVFIALFHVLRMFRPIVTSDGFAYRDNVYFFGSTDVQSFSNAKFFGHAPLGSFMTMPADELSFMHGDRAWVIAIGIPLTIMAGIATHLTSRRSVARQAQLSTSGLPTGQAAMMNKLMLYVFPLFVIVGGPFFPLAILIYWLANNSWTFGQLWLAHRIQDKRKAAEIQVVEQAKEVTKFSTPPPGAKPKRSTARPVVQPSPIDTGGAANGAAGTAGTNGAAGAAGTNGAATNGANGASTNGGQSKPKPGSRPAGSQPNRKKRKR